MRVAVLLLPSLVALHCVLAKVNLRNLDGHRLDTVEVDPLAAGVAETLRHRLLDGVAADGDFHLYVSVAVRGVKGLAGHEADAVVHLDVVVIC